MMTKKHFRRVAGILHGRMEARQGESDMRAELLSVASELASMFAAENHLFDRERFMEAVRTGKGAQ